MVHRSVVTVSLALFAASFGVETAAAACSGRVVNVRAISQYNHGSGSGFLAVRGGPGGRYRQTGEVYRGDRLAVYDRRGNWLEVSCDGGRCEDPLWGPAYPSGWVHRDYVRLSGRSCPR